MRENRSSGSVEGVTSNRDPYSDSRRLFAMMLATGSALVQAKRTDTDGPTQSLQTAGVGVGIMIAHIRTGGFPASGSCLR